MFVVIPNDPTLACIGPFSDEREDLAKKVADDTFGTDNWTIRQLDAPVSTDNRTLAQVICADRQYPHKIAKIRALREKTGLGLHDAKQLIEEVIAENTRAAADYLATQSAAQPVG